ncbi:MAG TPA: ABC transporter ATP-binding protein [Firmicutes bacterium]|nr:ABC transporter ATP-binding protein [Bacillota bacterium]
MIQVENLSKTYRMGSVNVEALREVTFSIAAGEFVAIVGPSGSGKSTLMHLLGCLDVPTAGSYRLDGFEVSRLTGNELACMRNRKIGFVFQGFNLLPRLTAVQNVELPLIYRGINPGARYGRARECLERVGLGDRLHHLPSQLSGGEQQRVAIARALAGEPAVILADEPTGNLDTGSGLEVLKVFDELHAAGGTIVLVTHDMTVAARAGRLLRLRDGMLVGDERVGAV